MRFLSFIAKNVLRRKVRSALTGIGVAVAIAAVVALLGVSRGFEESTRQMIAGHGVDLVVIREGAGIEGTVRLDEGIAGLIAQLPEVDKVAPVLTDRLRLEHKSSMLVPITGYPAGGFPMEQLAIQPGGHNLTAADKRGTLLGAILARNLDKKVEDTVIIDDVPFHVVGIYQGSNMVENGGAVTLLPDLQQTLGPDRKGKVTQFQVVLKAEYKGDPVALKRVQAEIKDLRDSKGAAYGIEGLTTDEYIDKSNEVRLSQAMAWMTSAIALVIGAVGMLNTMIMSVLERTQEIGILRAIGWRKIRDHADDPLGIVHLELRGRRGRHAGRLGAHAAVEPAAGRQRPGRADDLADGDRDWIFVVAAGRIGRGRLSGPARSELSADGGFAL